MLLLLLLSLFRLSLDSLLSIHRHTICIQDTLSRAVTPYQTRHSTWLAFERVRAKLNIIFEFILLGVVVVRGRVVIGMESLTDCVR